jgi:hypothetical protein
MSKMIQIRNVPDDLHRRLKARAAEEGLTLSDYLLRMAEREVGKLSVEEWLARVRARPPMELSEPPSAVIRRMRDAADV